MSQENAVPASVLPAGAMLQMGKYRIVRFIASGGFGNTYEVVNVEFEERMAMKEFFMRGVNERGGDSVSVSVSNAENKPQFEAQKEKLKKEARRLRKMHNGNIVKVHDLFEENGTVYYVMDYIDGESLSKRIKRTGRPLAENAVRRIIPQVLAALDEVHRNGIWHLDLKPANIMVDSHGRALLIDFGASKQMRSSEGDSVSTSSALCYTPGYAPMEQIEQDIRKFGPWTDFYALGATIYNLLTARQPPSSSEITEDNAFTALSSVSPRMRQLVVWLMQPARRRRPQSVGEIMEFINAGASGEPKREKTAVEEDDEETVATGKKEDKKGKIVDGIPAAHPVGRSYRGYMAFAGAVIVLSGLAVFVPKGCNPHKASPVESLSAADTAVVSLTGSTGNSVIDNLINNMVYVAGGTFTMGATSEQGSDVYDDAKPAHRVTLSSYYIGKYEVTQAEWKAVMGSNPSYFKGDNLPVENVSWDDCQTFIRKLNALTGRKFRLPTEAEWEFAARGGTNSRGYKYSGSNTIGSVAWNYYNSGSKTHPVGQKSPNELGLYDMSGNVEEWCQDRYGGYSSSSQTNPVVSGFWFTARVYRGGSWINAGKCRVSYRDFSGCDGDEYLGLRLAL